MLPGSRRAIAIHARHEIGVRLDMAGPRPIPSLSSVFSRRTAMTPMAPSSTPSHLLHLPTMAAQFLSIESGRIPDWDRRTALIEMRRDLRENMERVLDVEDPHERHIQMLSLFQFYTTRFHNDVFPHALMHRHLLASGRKEDAEKVFSNIAGKRVDSNRARFHLTMSRVLYFNSPRQSLFMYRKMIVKESAVLDALIIKASELTYAKVAIAAFKHFPDPLISPRAFAVVVRAVASQVPRDYSRLLMREPVMMLPLLWKHFSLLDEGALTAPLCSDMACIISATGSVSYCDILAQRAERFIQQDVRVAVLFAGAFLHLNMLSHVDQLLRKRPTVELSVPLHLKYLTLLSEFGSLSALESLVDGRMRFKAPVACAALLSHAYARHGQEDCDNAHRSMECVRANIKDLARHRASAVLFAITLSSKLSSLDELLCIAHRPAFQTNQRLYRIFTSVLTWGLVRAGRVEDANSVLKEAIESQLSATRGTFLLRPCAFGAVMCGFALKGDDAMVESLYSTMKVIHLQPTESAFTARLLSAAINGQTGLAGNISEAMRLQSDMGQILMKKECLVRRTAMETYDSIAFEDAALVNSVITKDTIRVALIGNDAARDLLLTLRPDWFK